MSRHGPYDLCPPWIGFLLAGNPLRRLLYDPPSILGGLVAEGMKVLEPGPGMGFFSLELARLAGPGGRVTVVDVQPKMLEGLRRRATRAGLVDRLELRLAEPASLGIGDLAQKVDFVLAFAMVHEVPDPRRFFAEIAAALKPGGRVLFSEPTWHVGQDLFRRELDAATAAGLVVESRPHITISRAALLKKSAR